MKGLILVGGFGTRLRPLTLTRPKPLVEFCNMPIVVHQIEALVKVGVKEVILAVSYQPRQMMDALVEMEKKITCSHETEPLGTAGPLALAKNLLNDGEPFFVFNSDVICEYPLKELLEYHKSHGKEGTIMVTQVEEPSKYGVIVSNEEGLILRFVEKPQVYVGNNINAGLYIFNKEILNRIELRPTSIEQEIFPKMAEEKQLHCMLLPGLWMDIGQPKDYLKGVSLYLKMCEEKHKEILYNNNNNNNENNNENEGNNVIGNCVIDPTAKISKTALIGPDVVIGANCIVEDGSRLSYSTLMDGCSVGSYSWVKNSIIGWDSCVGKWCRIEGITVLGEDVNIKDEIHLNGAIVLPHKTIKESLIQPGQIVM